MDININLNGQPYVLDIADEFLNQARFTEDGYLTLDGVKYSIVADVRGFLAEIENVTRD